MVKSFRIENRIIGENEKVFLIAEAGINHNGDLSIAKKLIDTAIEARVDAIKFQTFITENLLLTTTPKAEYQKKAKGDNDNFYKMLKEYQLTKDEFIILKNYCQERGIIFLSTPFDKEAVKWLEDLNVSAYKIGSGDMNNFSLLKLVCSKGKPILLSTGMATLAEVKESVDFIKSNGIDQIAIFQCTTNYPTPYEEINLNVIDIYNQEFPNDIIGFSDHSLGAEASIGAVVKGVKIIEKHFTLDKEMEGPDHKASLNPEELIEWVKAIRNIENALGTTKKTPTNSEIEIAKVARKSIVTLSDLKKGDFIREQDVAVKRPSGGISPKDFEKIIGKKVIRDIPKDSLLFWEDVE